MSKTERQEGDGTVCRICQPSSIEIVQYNARIKNAMRCTFERIHLLAPATFLITHPYYYFVLLLLLLLFLFCFYFGSHPQILKYRSIWHAVLVPLVINILAATAQAVSNTPTHTHTHAPTHRHT